jgi:hypothetical protein
MYERCCGLDVHKQAVVACVLEPGSRGQPHKEIRTFGTMTDGPSTVDAGDAVELRFGQVGREDRLQCGHAENLQPVVNGALGLIWWLTL